LVILGPYVDLRLGDHARVFVTVAFNEFSGLHPRPGIDNDIADGHEGFVEFGSNLHDSRLGRRREYRLDTCRSGVAPAFWLQADALSGDKGTTRMRLRSCLLRKTQ
jgi:hypothetical protein